MIRVLWMLLLVLVASAGVSVGEEPRKPLIGINMNVGTGVIPTGYLNLSLRTSYVDAVTAAGGIPVLLPPVEAREDVARLGEMVDGFVFVGGADINPARFGEEPHPATNLLHTRREDFDFMLMETALDSGKPILAVCLGMQVMNVALGGSLIQDIPDLVETDINHRPLQPGGMHAHDVEVKADTRLRDLLGKDRLGVNSIHHQACVVSEDSGLVVSAVAPDGIVEGIELPDHPFAVGVQWHPEQMTAEDPHLNLFRGLVEAAVTVRDGEQVAAAE